MSTAPQRSRQARAKDQLERQLKLGTKNTKEGSVSLTEKDKTRINKELTILKERV